MSTVAPMQCFACTRRHPAADPDTGAQQARTCDAFPEGIPFTMALGGDHRQPLSEDGGLRFLQADGERAAAAFAAWERTFGE